MLNQDDLKIIQNIVTSATSPLQKGQANLEKGISKLENSVGNLEKGQVKLENSVGSLNSKVSNIEKGQQRLERELKKEHVLLNEVIDVLDQEDHAIIKRLEKVEQHLGFSSVA